MPEQGGFPEAGRPGDKVDACGPSRAEKLKDARPLKRPVEGGRGRNLCALQRRRLVGGIRLPQSHSLEIVNFIKPLGSEL